MNRFVIFFEITMEETNKMVGDRIRGIRKVLGLSQNELGESLNITGVAIGNYERGRIPKGKTLQKIAEMGGVTVDWLLTGQGVAYAEEKEKVDFVREGRYISEEDEELLELLKENPEVVGLLRRYGKLKGDIEELQMQLVLTPQAG